MDANHCFSRLSISDMSVRTIEWSPFRTISAGHFRDRAFNDCILDRQLVSVHLSHIGKTMHHLSFAERRFLSILLNRYVRCLVASWVGLVCLFFLRLCYQRSIGAIPTLQMSLMSIWYHYDHAFRILLPISLMSACWAAVGRGSRCCIVAMYIAAGWYCMILALWDRPFSVVFGVG